RAAVARGAADREVHADAAARIGHADVDARIAATAADRLRDDALRAVARGRDVAAMLDARRGRVTGLAAATADRHLHRDRRLAAFRCLAVVELGDDLVPVDAVVGDLARVPAVAAVRVRNAGADGVARAAGAAGAQRGAAHEVGARVAAAAADRLRHDTRRIVAGRRDERELPAAEAVHHGDAAGVAPARAEAAEAEGHGAALQGEDPGDVHAAVAAAAADELRNNAVSARRLDLGSRATAKAVAPPPDDDASHAQ